MNDTFKFLDNLLEVNDKIVIGLSGGPDSMCLLHVLMQLKTKFNLTIICAHINHGLRVESEDEKIFVEEYCLKNNVEFEYLKIDGYKNNKFSEDEARRKRYNFFDEIVKKYNAKYLMTAHHGDDLIESVLMRIVRGSTLSGFIGIPKISTNAKYKIVRPLLYCSKKDIIKYLEKSNVPYCNDLSNESEKYTRNRFRKHVLPFLKNEDKNVHLKFLKYSEELEMHKNYINKIIETKIKEIYVDKRIVINKLLEEDLFLQKKIIEYIIKEIQKTEIFNINNSGLEQILNLTKSTANKKIDLADNFIARRSYNYLIIEKNNNDNKIEYKYEFDSSLKILDKYNFEIISESNLNSNNIIRLDKKDIKLPLYIRCKKDGDRIRVKNLNGTKKVKDIFINSKIDIIKRDSYPILVDSLDRVIWIPGIKKSTFDKDINEFCDIIIKYTEEKNE